MPDQGVSIDDQLPAWFYQNNARITRRGCGRKGQFNNGSIVDNTVWYHKHRTLWPLILHCMLADNPVVQILE